MEPHSIGQTSRSQPLRGQLESDQKVINFSNELTFVLDEIAWGLDKKLISKDLHTPSTLISQWREDVKVLLNTYSDFLNSNPNIDSEVKKLLRDFIVPGLTELSKGNDPKKISNALANTNATLNKTLDLLGCKRMFAHEIHPNKWEKWKKKLHELNKNEMIGGAAKNSSSSPSSLLTSTFKENTTAPLSKAEVREAIEPQNVENSIALASANVPLPPQNWAGNLPDFSQEGIELNAAQQELSEAHQKLNQASNPNDVIAYKSQIYQKLQKTYGPIDTIDPRNLPIPPSSLVVNSKVQEVPTSAGEGWYSEKGIVSPTNDWAQGLGQRSDGSNLGTVPFQAMGSNNGVMYSQPSSYAFKPNTVGPDGKIIPGVGGPEGEGIVETTLNAFQFQTNIGGNYTVSLDDGNLVRTFIKQEGDAKIRIFINQGSLWKGAEYTNTEARVVIPGGIQSYETIPSNNPNVRQIKVLTNDGQVILIASPSAINLKNEGDSFTSDHIGNSPAYVNVSSLPLNPSYKPSSEELSKFESEIWQGSGAVVTQGYGGVNYPGYEYAYQCVDLLGNPTAQDPLIALNLHAQETLCNVADPLKQGTGKTDLLYQTLTGPVRVVKGSNLQFQEISSDPTQTFARVPVLIKEPPSDELVKDMDEAIVQMQNVDIGDFAAGTMSFYFGAKKLFSMGETLELAASVMKQQGSSDVTIQQHLQGLANHLSDQIKKYWKIFAYDQNLKGIVSPNSWNYRVFNDQVTVAGYALEAIAKLQAFDKTYVNNAPGQTTWMDQMSMVANYTNKQMADMLCRNTAEKGTDDKFFPQTRSMDFFSGHSWLHGIDGGGNPRNIESTSECLNGNRAARDWLEASGRSDLARESAVIASMEARSAKAIAHIDSNTSIYPKDYAEKYLVATNLNGNYISSATWFGNMWYQQLAIHFIPPDPEMEDYLLYKTDPLGNRVLTDFAQRASDSIKKNWGSPPFDPLQTVLIGIMAQTDPETAKVYLDQAGNNFDTSTNRFILNYMIEAVKPNHPIF